MGFFQLKLLVIALSLLSIWNSTGISHWDYKPLPTIIDEQEQDESTSPPLTHQMIVDKMEEVIRHLVQPTNEQYQVLHYHNKEELIKSFRPYTSLSLAKKLVDLYYKERDKKLYIIPTETPPWFEESNDYQLNEIDHDIKQIIQTNKSDMYGTYTIKVEFTYTNKHGWIINEVEYT
jgi:hypothetical protein